MSTGIVHPLASEADDEQVELVAATFTGGGAVLTRLLPENLLEAETLAKQTVGFKLTGTRTVGRTRQRAIGFPAWPIITDPSNAQHALNLVADLEWARRQAGSSAKKVTDRFDTLTADLLASEPHFVPTLLEELARIFAGVGNNVYARRYFGRARDVERAHNVPVDPARHEAAFLEFARAGIVGAKDLTQEASDAAERFEDAGEAFKYVLGLNVSRIQAGQTPYAAMLRDLRKLGASAGLTDVETDNRIYDGVVGLALMYNAPAAFWKDAQKSLPAWLRDQPDADAFFLERKPKALDLERWLKLLQDSGVWDRLINDGPAFADWILNIIDQEITYPYDFSPRFLKAIEQATPHLTGKSARVSLNTVPPDFLDALLEAEVAIVDKPEDWDFIWSRGLSWEEWAEQKTHPRELSYLASDSVVSEKTRENFGSKFIGENLDLLLSRAGTRTLVSEHLDAMAAETTANNGSLPFLAQHAERQLKFLRDERLEELNPGAVAEMLRYDPAESLAAALRAGVLAELTWPAFEDAVDELRAEHPDGTLKLFDSYPQLVVTSAHSFRVIDGDEVTVSGGLPAIKPQITGAFVTGGEDGADPEVLLYFETQGFGPRMAYWHGGVAVAINDWNVFFPFHVTLSLPTDDGRRLTASGLLSPGEVEVWHEPARFLSNGEHVFVLDTYGTKRWDRETDAFVPFDEDLGSVPGFCPVDIPEGVIDWAESTMYLAQETTRDSLAGTQNGLHFTLKVDHSDGSSTYVTPLGEFSSDEMVNQVLARPGGGHWLQAARQFRDAETGDIVSMRSGVLDYLPITALHHLTPRSPEASNRLRTFTADDARELLDTLVAEPENTVKQPVSSIFSLWKDEIEDTHGSNASPGTPAWEKAAELIGSSDPLLVRAVVGMAVDTQTLSASYRADASGPDEVTDDVPFTDEAAWLLSDAAGLTNFPSSADRCERVFSLLAQDLVEHTTTIATTRIVDESRLFAIIGHERRLIGMLNSPALDPDILASVKSFLLKLVDTGVLASGWRSYRLYDGANDRPNSIYTPAWVDDVYVTSYSGWNAANPHYLVLARDTPTQVAGREVTDTDDPSMSAEEFRAALAALPTDRDVSAEAKLLAEETLLSRPEATFILGGHLGRAEAPDGRHEKMITSHRENLGLSAPAYEKASISVRWMDTDLLFAMAMGSSATEKADIWCRETGDLGYPLTDSEHSAISATFTHPGQHAADVLAPLSSNSQYDNDYLVAPLLILAQLRRSDDPIRLLLAKQLNNLRTLMDESAQRRSTSDVALGGDYDSQLGTFSQTYRVLTEGHADELIEDLTRVYDSPAGHPLDQAVSAPQVLAAVEKALGLEPDQARYFLQILALATPTDANIKEWNGWKKKDIDTASAPLVERGLLLEAKRSSTGRTRFLPGGWLAPAQGNKGMEVWKAPLYLVWKDVKLRPVVRANPPLVPMPRLFADAWQRYADGDVPGYENLTTTRYRRN